MRKGRKGGKDDDGFAKKEVSQGLKERKFIIFPSNKGAAFSRHFCQYLKRTHIYTDYSTQFHASTLYFNYMLCILDVLVNLLCLSENSNLIFYDKMMCVVNLIITTLLYQIFSDEYHFRGVVYSRKPSYYKKN